jgi:hypothetical protein
LTDVQIVNFAPSGPGTWTADLKVTGKMHETDKKDDD